MAEMMYQVRYYCKGQRYQEIVPGFNLEKLKDGLAVSKDCALISVTEMGIAPNMQKPLYNLCMPYIVPGENAILDESREELPILLKVVSKRSGAVRVVHQASDHEPVRFLLYRDGKWVWEDSQWYEPVNQEERG